MTTHASNTSGHAPVTVLGLGPMGQALAGALLDNGHPTTGWNRSADKAAALVARGAVLAPTIAEAAAASPLSIASVLNYDVVDAVLDAAGEAIKGRAVVSLTSDSPTRPAKPLPGQPAAASTTWTGRS